MAKANTTRSDKVRLAAKSLTRQFASGTASMIAVEAVMCDMTIREAAYFILNFVSGLPDEAEFQVRKYLARKIDENGRS